MRHNPYLYGRPGDKFYYAQKKSHAQKSHARLTRAASAMDIGPQMCARYSLTKEQITMLIGEVEVIINLGARYNIAPTQIVPAIWRSARGIETVDMQRWTCNGVSNRRGAGSRSSTPRRRRLPQRRSSIICIIAA